MPFKSIGRNEVMLMTLIVEALSWTTRGFGGCCLRFPSG